MDQVASPAPGGRLVQGWDGRDYERHSAQQRSWGGDLIAELALRGDERVLDLGCGDGTLTARLAGLVPNGSVLGIDAAPEMLAAAQEKCGPNMRVTVGDIQALDFADAFDLVFSNAALHWVPDHAAGPDADPPGAPRRGGFSGPSSGRTAMSRTSWPASAARWPRPPTGTPSRPSAGPGSSPPSPTTRRSSPPPRSSSGGPGSSRSRPASPPPRPWWAGSTTPA